MDVLERIEKGELVSYVIEMVIDERGVKDVESRNDLSVELMCLAKIGKQMQWVSIKDNIPKKEEDVIVFRIDDHNSCIGWIGESGQWWSNGEMLHSVTHWMPVPPNPGENK
jgi:hypothetical protein